MTNKVRLLLLFSLCVAFVIGCGAGGKTSLINGKVTYNGTPVTGGNMTFYPAEGGSFPVMITSDGSYSVVGVPPGEAVVTVETESINPNKETPVYGGGRGSGMSPVPPGAGGGNAGTYVKIPGKYAKKETTDYKITVAKGEQTINIELKD